MKRFFAFLLCFVMALSLIPAAAAEDGTTPNGNPPVITTQPSNKSVVENTSVKFTVKATGAASYQWQYRKNSTTSWYNSTGTGNKTAALTVDATSARNGFEFRCKVTNASGSTYSSAAKLTVCTQPKITTQPTNKTAALGATVKYTVKASGGALSYQWQYRKSSSGTWYNSSGTGNKTATLSVEATEARNGFQFRCKVTNLAGSVYSSAAKLTVVTKPTITTQPTSKTVTAGTTVKFKVVATGAESYRWQYRKNSSDTWHDSGAAGNKTSTLSIEATAARNGFQFRCKITNAAGTVCSSVATLTVKSSATVYWVPNGTVYHSRTSCRSLARSKTILCGTIEEAYEAGKTAPCKNCW